MILSDLEAEPDRVEVDALRVVHVPEALPEGVDADVLSLLERLGDVLPPDALDPQVLKLDGHVLVVDVHGADALLAAVAADLKNTTKFGFFFINDLSKKG